MSKPESVSEQSAVHRFVRHCGRFLFNVGKMIVLLVGSILGLSSAGAVAIYAIGSLAIRYCPIPEGIARNEMIFPYGVAGLLVPIIVVCGFLALRAMWDELGEQ